MERSIGDIIKYNNTLLRVEDVPFCEECFFKDKFPCFGKPHHKVVGQCEYLYRTDRKSVSFVEIKNNR